MTDAHLWKRTDVEDDIHNEIKEEKDEEHIQTIHEEILESKSGPLNQIGNETEADEAKILSKCHICGKFYEKRNLNRHISTVHEGKRDYKCEYCGLEFASAQTLKIHVTKT